MQETAEDLAPGTVVAGRYRIRRLLGRGGMGVVYEAEHTSLGRVVALKLLLSNASSDGEAVARFFQEARSAAAIGHPGIVEVFDLSQPGEPPFLVMERLEGEELRDRMKRGALSTQELIGIATELCDAVGAAHANGIVHRDLKPDNVFLARRADRSVVKVLDFGIAKLVRPTHDLSLTTTGQIFGTPLYMSPEQMRGTPVDSRTDVYALGAIMYECLAGQPPFNAETVTELVVKVSMDPLPPLARFRPDLPHGLVSLIESCLSKDPNGRPSDARQLAHGLRALGGAATPAPYAASPHSAVAATTPMHGATPAPIAGPPSYGAPSDPALAYGSTLGPAPAYGPPPQTTTGGSSGFSIGCILAAIGGGLLLLIGVPAAVALAGVLFATSVPEPNIQVDLDPSLIDPEDPDTTVARDDPDPPPTVQVAAHVQLNQKIGPLISQCVNAYSGAAQRARSRYFGWLDDREGGPTGHERRVGGVGTLSDRDGRRCTEAVRESNATAPSLPELEQEASRYAEAVAALAPLLGQASEYYELETYRDDGMTRGRELHPQLVAAFAQFDQVDEPFRERLLDLEAEVRAGRVAELQADPSRRDEYLTESYQQQALVVVRLAPDIHLEGDHRLHSDTEAEFTEAVNELARRGQLISEHTSSNSSWSSYQSSVSDFSASALRTMRAMRDGTTFRGMQASWIGTSSGWMVEGSPDALVHEYDSLRSSVRFLR